MNWVRVCKVEDIVPGTGVCALVGEAHVAVFRPHPTEEVFALSNIDPFFQSSVLSRGLIAEHQGQLWVASPLRKQRFRLNDGVCMESAEHSVRNFKVRVQDGCVEVAG